MALIVGTVRPSALVSAGAFVTSGEGETEVWGSASAAGDRHESSTANINIITGAIFFIMYSKF